MVVLNACSTCEGVFQPKWHTYIVELIHQHRQRCLSPVIIAPPIPCAATELTVDSFFLPEVIIWDPIRQFPAIFSGGRLLCEDEQCRLPMKLLTWQDGSKQRYNPRCLYGVRGVVVLVGQIHYCPNGHFLTTCNPRFLATFSERNCIPFILLYRSGITRELQDLIFNMASRGKAFTDIETLLLWTLQQDSAWKGVLYLNQLDGIERSSCRNTILPPTPTTYISNDHIMQHFLLAFQEMKDYLIGTMCELTGEYCSCDHTFKVAKHIGIQRKDKWIPQYDSLFIIQNEIGQIIFWQLTMGTAYGAVRDGIESVKTRLIEGRRELKLMTIDNCCMWRRLLQETFGEQLEVKLDLLHAVQRISKSLSKKHSYFFNFLQDFRLVFRNKGDNGPKRTKPTPEPDVLLTNLDSFLTKWKEIASIEGNKIVNPAVLKAIQNLKGHIQKGCLTGIPPECGTNRNENLHRSLNCRLAGNRIGVELALALLMTFFHSWNASRSKQETTSPLAGFLQIVHDTMLHHTGSSTSIGRSSSNGKIGIGINSKRQYSTAQLGTAFHQFKHKQPMQVLQELKQQPHNMSTNDDLVYSIVHKALSLLHLERQINDLSNTHAPVSRLLPCLLSSFTSEADHNMDTEKKSTSFCSSVFSHGFY